MDTYGDAGGYGDAAELYGGGSPNPPIPSDNRMGGTGAIRKPPRP